MKIVKFKDGSYGIRKGVLFFYSYLDLFNQSYWWHFGYKTMAYCRGTLEECEKLYNLMTDKGEPI